jgi:glycosyltransferase involved in cell wall biosynthesis
MTLRNQFDRFYVNGENVGVPFGRMMMAATDFGRVTLPVHRADEPVTQRRLKQLGPRVWQNTIVVADSQADILRRIGYPEHKIHRFTNMNPDIAFFRPQGRAGMGEYVFTCGRESRDYATLKNVAAMSRRPFRIVDSGLATTVDFASGTNIAASSNIVLERNLSYTDLRSAYENARFVVMPVSRVEYAAGVSTIGEAMAMGKAVIATDSPGIREYVRHGRSGLVVPAGDAEAMHRAIEELWNDPERCAAMGAYNRAWVERSMNLMLYVDQVCGLYGID